MITCSLQGGLGNIMFQIATGYAYALDNGYDFGIKKNTPINCCTKYFNDISVYSDNIFRNIKDVSFNPTTKYNEPYFHYKKIDGKDNMIVNGYFQSYKYFEHRRKELLKLFSIKDDTIINFKKKYPYIGNEETVSVHVRRKDYEKYQHIHPLVTMDYYNQALENFSRDIKIIIFSDDMSFCKENFKNAIHIDEQTDYEDMWLMSMCTNNIIANSTFSWWGAWLNKNESKKVIAPKKWFGDKIKHNIKDLYSREWELV